jgi:adenylate kinase
VGFYQKLAAAGNATAPRYARIEGVGAVDEIASRVFAILD